MDPALEALADLSIEDLLDAPELFEEEKNPGELFGEGGALRAADLVSYRSSGPESWSQVERISYRHHRFAQLVALGHSGVEISKTLSMTQASVSRLKASPGVSELIESYSQKLLEYDSSFQLRLQVFRDMTLEEVEKEITGGRLRGKDLAQVLFQMMDRTGYGPKKTEDVNLNLGVSQEQLKHMQRAYDGANSARIISDPIDITSSAIARPLPNAQTENLRLGVGPEGEEITAQFLDERDETRTESRAAVREKIRKDAVRAREGGKCHEGAVNCPGGRTCPHGEEGT